MSEMIANVGFNTPGNIITVEILCSSAAEMFKAVSAIGSKVISVTRRKNPVKPKCTKARYRRNEASNVSWTLRRNSCVARYG